MAVEIDKDTKKELSEGEHIRMMTESEGWRIVYAKLQDKILDLQNINNIDDSTPENALADMKARKMAAVTLFAWAKEDVYGRVEQSQTAQDALTDKGTQHQFIGRE